MANRLIGAMLAIVIGLALLPVVIGFVDDLTGVGGSLVDTTLGTLVDLLPVLYVIVIIGGAVGYIAIGRKN